MKNAFKIVWPLTDLIVTKLKLYIHPHISFYITKCRAVTKKQITFVIGTTVGCFETTEGVLCIFIGVLAS